MSHNKIREDKTCLNCRHVVEQKFCPNCGQENSDSRKTFHHLFVHFFEDLTHYENAFWKTIRNLLFKPATLTKEYLSGKRLSYLAPVRLYIFISFITFLLIAMLPVKVNENNKSEKEINKEIAKTTQELNIKKEDNKYFHFSNMKKIDSIQKHGKEEDKLNATSYWFAEKAIHISEKYTKKEIFIKFTESFFHNLPKILFIIMPFFAFFLWLFHNKKKCYYFDHGIFTLHYFSFLLLIFLVMFIIDRVVGLFGEDSPLNVISTITSIVGTIWMCYYFYPAHHRFYGESRIVSFVKSVLLFIINSLFILFLLTVYVLYTFINIH
ncbi:DUF3667 domain-containing protein [Flavobacterium sp. LM4]|uniref:DUF3667 domain-containing protein n=1 Tax=Flavobacterium sp. LM4 TaxID=1938609 RepID=UPI00099421E4|nr:DUF3667 domain-containing protein [Flavobacterium sp. LM4]OOV19287.1 hypothetical protein BXU10_06340 [Flavobacterium sp. LM4]